MTIRSADLLDYPSGELLAVRSPDKHPVALKSDGYRSTGFEFPGNIPTRTFLVEFTDEFHAVHLDNHCIFSGSDETRSLGTDFPLGLSPIFVVSARNATALNVDLFGPPTDRFAQIFSTNH